MIHKSRAQLRRSKLSKEVQDKITDKEKEIKNLERTISDLEFPHLIEAKQLGDQLKEKVTAAIEAVKSDHSENIIRCDDFSIDVKPRQDGKLISISVYGEIRLKGAEEPEDDDDDVDDDDIDDDDDDDDFDDDEEDI